MRTGQNTLRVSAASTGAHPEDGVADITAPARPDRSAATRLIGGRDRDGAQSVEVVVEGWRFEFLVEESERAELRSRASRAGQAAGGHSASVEIRAIIPGRVVSIAVAPGDHVDAGQALLVVEAMKMQNDLRAPRAGIVHSITVAAGSTVELGDILAVLR